MSKKLQKFIETALVEVDAKIKKLEDKLREENADNLDEDKLSKALDCQKVIMLMQATIKGGIKWLATKNIEGEVAISFVASNLDVLTKQDNPSLICNYTYMQPETIEDLEYHFDVLMTFLEAKKLGWKSGVYTHKDVKEFRKKTEQQAKEYETFVVRGRV